MKKGIVLLVIVALFGNYCQGQINWNLGGRIENAVERKIDQGIDRSIDKGVDKSEEEIRKGGKKATEKEDGNNSKNTNSNTNSNNNQGSSNSSNGESGTKKSNTTPPTNLQSYSKFDFVPGEKIIAVEDFAQDAIGDFPAKWNTNGSGEIVTIGGQDGKWLKFGPKSIIYPEFVNGLPENFTIEFNLASTSEFSFYSTSFYLLIAQLGNVQKEYMNWNLYGKKKNGMEFGLHPQSAGSGLEGQKHYVVYDAVGDELIKNESDFLGFNREKNIVKISIWRQKTRFRMYVNDEKVWDIPKAFDPASKYNFIGFRADNYHENNNAYFLSNLRVAVGAPDTRNKLITEGKYTTTGILFDVNSDKIKPESYGTLKDIANVLTENPDVKIKIIGHTDSDGDEAKNLELSKKRSESVKVALNKDFGISLDRMQTDGKGESQPVGDNATVEGKANNRRVEFIKM